MKLIFCITISVFTYLSIVAIWAKLSLAELLREEEFRDIKLSKEQINILLTIEDPTFHSHNGIDLSNGQGLTTISSSIARDLFLYRHQLSGIKGIMQKFYAGVFNCCKKIDIGRDLMAIVLNHNLSKNKQLSFYTANIYMGSHKGKPIHGLTEASLNYYGKTLVHIKEDEFLSLVAMIKAPNRYHLVKNPAENKLRTDKIKNIINGTCMPKGWFDTHYNHCAPFK